MLHADSRVGMSYLIDAECVNGGVPYSDHFSTVVRYCIKRVAASMTRLSITGKVQYHKSVWTFIQSTQLVIHNGFHSKLGILCPFFRFWKLHSHIHKNLSCRRETVPCFVPLNISLSHTGSFKVIRNDITENGVSP